METWRPFRAFILKILRQEIYRKNINKKLKEAKSLHGSAETETLYITHSYDSLFLHIIY